MQIYPVGSDKPIQPDWAAIVYVKYVKFRSGNQELVESHILEFLSLDGESIYWDQFKSAQAAQECARDRAGIPVAAWEACDIVLSEDQLSIPWTP